MSLIHFSILFYKDFNVHKKHQMIKEANLFLKLSFSKNDVRRAESYIISLNWIVTKKATTTKKNSKNEKDIFFQWSTISGLNYNKSKEKELKKNTKI